MANRFQEVYRLPDRLFIEGSPVIIEAGAIQKDTVSGKVLAQIKLRNISEKPVAAARADVRTFAVNSTELEGVPGFSYLDLNAETGQDFGSKVPIYLPDPTARRFTVSVTEVVFQDGTLWQAEPCEWEPVPAQETAAEHFPDPEMKKQYALEAGGDAAFIPVVGRGLFQCACGAVNLAGAERCYKCRRSYEMFTSALDEYTLTQKMEDRLRSEKEAREVEAAAAEAKKRKTRKILKILIPVAAVIAVIAALTPGVIRPAIEKASAYREATQLLEVGSFDEAKDAFDALEDYKDSADMSKEAVYRKAESFYAEKDYEKAISIWQRVNDYSDSSERIETAKADWKESDYQAAVEAANGKDYKAALTAFKALGDYKDSKELYISGCYEYAVSLAADKQFSLAIDYFNLAKGYKDADQLKTDTVYLYGCDLMSKKRYREAVAQFNKCKEYKNTPNKLLEAKYKYVTSHLTSKDNMTFHYLKDLIAADYPEAQDIYDEIYQWKIQITAVNNSEESTATMSSVSRYDTIYFHYKVTGGTPGESLEITMNGQLPNCPLLVRTATVNGDWSGFYCIYYTYGSSSGTASAMFYDPEGNELASASIYVY